MYIIYVYMFPGQTYGYRQGSIKADSTDVVNTVFDQSDSTCLQFLGGVGGTPPSYTHMTLNNLQQALTNVSIRGHNIGCGTSMFLILQPDNATQQGKTTRCEVTSSYTENGLEICTHMCTCPEGFCGQLDIIHRPMTQPSDWQLCAVVPG